MPNKLETIGDYLLPAIAYGDAAGLPFENHLPMESGRVQGLEDVIENPFVGEYPAGTWSDDTHLSLVTAISLISSKKFDIVSQARAHVIALDHLEGNDYSGLYQPPIKSDEFYYGWGPGTTKSIERIRGGADPAMSGETKSAGNGVLMKMAPLVYWQTVTGSPDTQAEKEIIAFTKMTHNTPEAIVSSLVHRRMLKDMFRFNEGNEKDGVEIYAEALRAAEHFDAKHDPDNITSSALKKLSDPVKSGELQPTDIIEAAPKRGFRASETLLMAYGGFVINSHFPEGSYRIIELGGDTDSTASIISTMSLGLSGEFIKPHDYDKLYDINRLENVSSRLSSLAFANS